jgi:hypothetical protein
MKLPFKYKKKLLTVQGLEKIKKFFSEKRLYWMVLLEALEQNSVVQVTEYFLVFARLVSRLQKWKQLTARIFKRLWSPGFDSKE